MIRHVLTIAGSDPSGGAGIQADLKTFSANGCYGMSVITALTAQNTQGVSGIHEAPAEFVGEQITQIFADIRVDAIKIGMLGSPATIHVIAEKLKELSCVPVVLDPVMVAQSGDRLISDEAVKALQNELIPQARLITPNIPEAEVLLGTDYSGDAKVFASALYGRYGVAALLKGGHDHGLAAVDILANEAGLRVFEAPRIETKNNHGTGCTLSSALACELSKGHELAGAVQNAKDYITRALGHGHELSVGQGAGPVHHFYSLWGKR